jgi:ubiquinol-cytochrome c reductase cytochrome c subunit
VSAVAGSEAAVRRRILRYGLLLAVAGQILWSFRPAPGRALTAQEAAGKALFEASCSTCHGLQAEGSGSGPSLQGVGPAGVDFMLSTGRMPLANPGAQPIRQQPRFDPQEIAAIVAYVAAIAPGGPGIPTVYPQAGDLPRGAQLFLNNCSACHGAGATGDSVGGGQIAPSLYPASATQIGEAVRVGPGVMPKFAPADLSARDLNSIARYVLWLRDHGDRGGLQLGRVGAVAEGFVAIVVGLGLLLLVLRLTGSKT